MACQLVDRSGYRFALIYSNVIVGRFSAHVNAVARLCPATRFELVINVKTAKALGLEIPATLLWRPLQKADDGNDGPNGTSRRDGPEGDVILIPRPPPTA